MVYAEKQSFTELCILPGGLYGQRKRVDGSRVTVALDPQPAAVIEVHQLCRRLKRYGRYQRPITYVTGYECFIAEYLGKFQQYIEVHRNAVYRTGEYVRTKPEVLASISAATKSSSCKPLKLYQELKAHNDDDQQRPRNKKQVLHITSY